MAKRTRSVGTALALLLAAGCSGDDDGAEDDRNGESGGTTTTVPEPLEVLWSATGAFTSQPALVGDRVVAYLDDGGALQLVAYDAATGEEVWRRPTTASSVTNGVALGVAADDGYAFHMLAMGEDAAAIEAVDVATGDTAWTSEISVGGFEDVPEPCPEAEDRLCVTANDSSDSGSLWSIEMATGALTRTAEFDGRELTQGLYDRWSDERIVRVVDGEVLWERTPSELFEGRAVTPDMGWSWEEHDDLLVGWFGTDEERVEAGEQPITAQFMAGVDAATGETRWVAEGEPACGWRLSNMQLRVDGEEPLFRCRFTGSHRVEDGSLTDTTLTSGVIEGFDPATGEATWSVPLDGASVMFAGDGEIVRLDPSTFTLVLDDGTRIGVDVAAGEAVDVPADAVGWCTDGNTYGQGDDRRVGEPLATACDLAGERQPAPLTAEPELGAVDGDRFAWLDAEGLHLARVS